MGATLSSRVEWTSASTKAGKLDFSKTNENILREIVKYVENLCRSNPREALVVFKHPFVWSSPASLSSFESLKSGVDYELSESCLVSVAKTDSGEPHLNITKAGEGVTVRVLNFKQIQVFLSCTGDKKLNEVRLCLEANQDPIGTIMGPGFASSGTESGGATTLLEVHERLTREKVAGREGPNMDELDSSFRLLLLLNSLDLSLLHSSVQQLGKEVRLSPESVEAEVNLLKQFSGDKVENSCLKDISFTSEMVFSNGCRAPPWRQVLGDIAYISATPVDGDPLSITASTEGYFTNKGMKVSGEVDPERSGGQVYPTLVALLKASSQQFTSNIGKQEYVYVDESDVGGEREGEEGGATEVPQHDVAESADQQKTPKKSQTPAKKTPTTAEGAKRGKGTSIPKSTFQGVSSLEPSQKWQSLGMSDELYVTAPETPIKTTTAGSKKRANIITPPGSTGKSATSIKSKSHRSSASPGDMDDSESSSDDSEEEDQQDRRPLVLATQPGSVCRVQ